MSKLDELYARVGEKLEREAEKAPQMAAVVPYLKERAAVLAEQMEQLRNEKRSAEAQAASAGNSAVQTFAVRFENLQREFDELTDLLAAIRQEDAAMADKLSGAMQRLLAQMQTSFGAEVAGDA